MGDEKGLTILAPTVRSTKEAWDKLQAYSRCMVLDGKTRRFVEISGYLIGEQISPQEFLLTDALLVPSTGTMGSTEMDNEGTAKLLDRLIQSEDPEDHQLLRSMKGWWHVHPGGGGCFWSKQDEDQMDKFGEGGYDWLISVVFSHVGPGYRARIDFFRPYRIYVDNISIEIAEDMVADELQARVQAEVDEHVAVPKVKVYQRGGMGFHQGPGLGTKMPDMMERIYGGAGRRNTKPIGQANWEKAVEKFRIEREAMEEKAASKLLKPAKKQPQKKGKKKKGLAIQ